MAGMLELDWEFETTIMPPGKQHVYLNSMQKQMDNVNREMEILRKRSKRNARDKNNIIKIKSAFDELSEWTQLKKEDIWVSRYLNINSQNWKVKRKILKNKQNTRIPMNGGTNTKGVIYE